MTTTFSHSGDIGDLIAALATVKALGGGHLRLFPSSHTGYRMTRERAESLRPLLEAQTYLASVQWAEGPTGTNLDAWRGRYNSRLNIADMVADCHGAEHFPRERPWLTVPRVNRVARVVFHRSNRYLNWNFVPALKRAWRTYHLDAVFVGSSDEHRDFVLHVGPVAYYPTRDHLELAEVIAGADLYIGNQSGNWWLAEALKTPALLEVCLTSANCHFAREFGLYGVNEDTWIPGLDDLRPRWGWNAVKKAEDRSLLDTGRLRTIAEVVRQTERLPGDLAELGVFRGGSAKVMGWVSPGTPLHLFDTFAGIPEDDELPGGHRRGEFACGADEVEAFLANPRAVFHVGMFPETAVDGLRFRCVHLDGDTYQTTRAALAYFGPRMVAGGVIALDDCDWEHCPGVRRAIDEAGYAAEKPTPHQGVVRFDALKK
ncbi:TylF/MycF/NovP-related O-methyltransferase [Fimbriiglobus ruber]|uniref:Methyltransferase n=1 Tax=Fimbriiglobus ruber TaxID=1908690 RepID=A0A225E1T5_9BACT|nr:TylF/MycF/NovP-related O-methyltransferase [Fimbriiglobus ruber]OWK45744.1 Methyltransferase [Fimbriiglobus ruber]